MSRGYQPGIFLIGEFRRRVQPQVYIQGNCFKIWTKFFSKSKVSFSDFRKSLTRFLRITVLSSLQTKKHHLLVRFVRLIWVYIAVPSIIILGTYVHVYVLKRLIAVLAKVSAKVSDENLWKSEFWLFTPCAEQILNNPTFGYYQETEKIFDQDTPLKCGGSPLSIPMW